MVDELGKLEEEVRANPGSEKFVELARLLADDPARRAEAREICYQGLTAQPENKLARLTLARLFYLDKMYEFAARELVELAGTDNAPSVDKLLVEFGSLTLKYMTQRKPADQKNNQQKDENIVAELDMDTNFLEALNELEEEQ